MNFKEAIGSCYFNYFNFKGRARRKELWYFILFYWLLGFLLGVVQHLFSNIMNKDSPYALLGIITLLSFMPFLAVVCRRFHDIGKSGTTIFFWIIPIIGPIIILVNLLRNGQPHENRYGFDPKNNSLINEINSIGQNENYNPKNINSHQNLKNIE